MGLAAQLQRFPGTHGKMGEIHLAWPEDLSLFSQSAQPANLL
jgi:hypothetical protein